MSNQPPSKQALKAVGVISVGWPFQSREDVARIIDRETNVGELVKLLEKASEEIWGRQYYIARQMSSHDQAKQHADNFKLVVDINKALRNSEGK